MAGACAYMLYQPIELGDPPEPLHALAVFPFLICMYLYLEYPPMGRGVGKQAGALPGLKFVVTAKPKKKKRMRVDALHAAIF